jgi:hypothetical protein
VDNFQQLTPALETFNQQVMAETSRIPAAETEVAVFGFVVISPAEGFENQHSPMVMAASSQELSAETIVQAMVHLAHDVYGIRVAPEGKEN